MHSKTHLGTFQGERLARENARRPDTSAAQDIAGVLALLAFWAAVAVVVVAVIVPELPA